MYKIDKQYTKDYNEAIIIQNSLAEGWSYASNIEII